MNIDLIVKIFFINVLTYFVFNKVKNRSIIKSEIVKTVLASALGTITYMLLNKYTEHIAANIILYFIQIILLKTLFFYEEENIITTNLLANAIVYIGFVIAMLIESIPMYLIKIHNNTINIIMILIIETILIIGFFNIKRFKKGFDFLNNKSSNDYIDIIVINISIAIILIYYLFGSYYGNLTKHILISFIILSIIMFIMIQKTLTLYYKQKLLARTIDDYKVEIEQKDKKIEELSEEKFKISKLNHEFYNRQKALEQKVNEFIKNKNLNMETAEELSPIKQIQNLSDEYSEKLENIKHLEKLSLTEIEEIDDMFKYMQVECKKNNIDFKLQVNGNIHHLINKLIPQDRLVTLIGDHIRDAIIAVNSSNNKFRSIVTFIGIKDNYYEFSVYDTGIEFEIETLVNLGTKPITTHKDTGGTGIGFITTFETLKETKASLIIEEKHKEMDNDYTKAVNIKFDGKGEYRINSYRANEIKEKDKKGRIIIEK